MTNVVGAPAGLQLALLEEADGRQVADLSPAVTGLVFTDGPHGFESLTADVKLTLRQAFRWYQEARPLYTRLACYPGPAGTAWDGRLEDRALTANGLRMAAFGYWRAFFDVPYSGLWSWSGTAGWSPVNADNTGAYFSDLWEMDNNNRIYIAPRQGDVYDFFHQGGQTFQTPHRSERPIIAIDFDYYLIAPAGWKAVLIEGNWDDYSLANTKHWELTSAGSPQAGTISITFSPGANRLVFALYYNNVLTPIVYPGATGGTYLRITNLRLASTIRDRIDTTLGTTISAGTQTVTPGSMRGIYVGQLLRINQGHASTAETVVVTAVTSTTLTAVFVYAHANTHPVEAIVCYADEIAESLVEFVDSTNPGQLNTNTADIEAHGRDLLNESFSDVLPADALTYLAGMGDSTGRRWEVGVRDKRRLFFRPQGSIGRTWYVDATRLDLERSLDDLANSVYAVHPGDATGQAGLRRTVATEDNLSVERMGLVRRTAVPSTAVSVTQAGLEAQATLDYRSNPAPRLALEFDDLFTAGGARVRQKWQVRTGDTIVLRNIDPTLLAGNDQLLSFRIGRVRYMADGDRLAVEPETPAPTLVQMLVEASFAPNIDPSTHGGWGGDVPGPNVDPGHSGWGGGMPPPIIIG